MLRRPAALCCIALLPACHMPESARPGASAAPAVAASSALPGPVADTAAFEAFIATQPTPAAFRERYPDVKLVLPGDIATKELRLDRSRYFAELDAQGRIPGGRFQ